ncbi:MAG: arsenate reductase ArsC [Burkholderiales bacterium]
MTAVDRPYNVLFLCTANSARSIMAESLLREIGKGRFNSYSAGSQPKGQVHPKALELLKSQRMPTEGLSSKAWDVFAKRDAPQMDFVITVCDNAAGEVCPVWPGQPITAHWGIPDPAAVEGSEEAQRRAFSDTCHMLLTRIRLFTSLPLAKLDRLALKRKLDDIGRRPS